MKNILKIITLVIFTLFITTSCQDEVSNYDALTKQPNAGITDYYVQFINNSKTFELGKDEAGESVDKSSTIAVVLMGAPQSADITVNLSIDPSSTMTADMFEISAMKLTIPAGKTSATLDFKTIATKMPENVFLKLVLNADAGTHNSPNINGIKLIYDIKRLGLCPLVNGVTDLAGSWSVTSSANAADSGAAENPFTAVVNGDKIDISGIAVSMINNFWGETVIAGGTFSMEVGQLGTVNIPRQYIYTTDYKGASSDYEIEGSGKWDNCGPKPVLKITYDIYYAGDADGLAKTYASYLSVPYFGGTFTLN